MTFAADSVTGVDFNVALSGYEPIGVIQQQFALGSGFLCITNCIVDGNYVRCGVMNRGTTARTTRLMIVVLYRKASS